MLRICVLVAEASLPGCLHTGTYTNDNAFKGDSLTCYPLCSAASSILSGSLRCMAVHSSREQGYLLIQDYSYTAPEPLVRILDSSHGCVIPNLADRRVRATAVASILGKLPRQIGVASHDIIGSLLFYTRFHDHRTFYHRPLVGCKYSIAPRDLIG